MRRCRLWVVGCFAFGLAFAGSEAAAQALPNGGVGSGAISVSGEQDTWTFSANTGQNFRLRVADLSGTSTFGPSISLYNPSGTFVTFGQGQNVGSISVQANATGTWSVVVADGSTTHTGVGAYNLYFALAPGANEGGALNNGGVQNGAIDLGDLDSYTFAANAGEGVRLRVADLSGTNGFGPLVALYDPSGAFVTFGQGQNVGLIDYTPIATGTYTVMVADGSTNGEGVGSYNLYFTRAPGANEGGLLNNGGVNPGAIDLGDLDSYSFAANAGESIQLRIADLSGGTFAPGFNLYGPSGAFISGSQGLTVGHTELQVTATGSYTVVVADTSTGGAAFGGYDLYFTLAPGANEGGRLYDGVTRLDTIDLGDLDSYTFTATAGQTAQVTVTDTSGGTLTPIVSLYGPNGAFLTSASGPLAATLSRAITTTGTYTLVVSDSTTTSGATGSYSIVLTGAGGAPPIPILPY